MQNKQITTQFNRNSIFLKLLSELDNDKLVEKKIIHLFSSSFFLVADFCSQKEIKFK